MKTSGILFDDAMGLAVVKFKDGLEAVAKASAQLGNAWKVSLNQPINKNPGDFGPANTQLEREHSEGLDDDRKTFWRPPAPL